MWVTVVHFPELSKISLQCYLAQNTACLFNTLLQWQKHCFQGVHLEHWSQNKRLMFKSLRTSTLSKHFSELFIRQIWSNMSHIFNILIRYWISYIRQFEGTVVCTCYLNANSFTTVKNLSWLYFVIIIKYSVILPQMPPKHCGFHCRRSC